jgi:hypothetical protein
MGFSWAVAGLLEQFVAYFDECVVELLVGALVVVFPIHEPLEPLAKPCQLQRHAN